MSETIKVVIEIPKKVFEARKTGEISPWVTVPILDAVQNGIPLDDVKAEIRKLKYFPATSEYELDYNAGLIATIDILDNIGKESEGTNE